MSLFRWCRSRTRDRSADESLRRAEEIQAEAQDIRRRVEPGLAELEAHKRRNGIYDAVLRTIREAHP